MKLSWTFYPKGEKNSVTLTVIYLPELDPHHLSSGGFLQTINNTAYVDWTTYKRFDSADLEGRKDAFQRLTRLTNEEEMIIKGQRILISPQLK